MQRFSLFLHLWLAALGSTDGPAFAVPAETGPWLVGEPEAQWAERLAYLHEPAAEAVEGQESEEEDEHAAPTDVDRDGPASLDVPIASHRPPHLPPEHGSAGPTRGPPGS